MNIFKRITAFLLLASVSAACAACAGNSDTAALKGSAADADSGKITSAETGMLDYLPKADYGGKKFTILIRTGYEYEFQAEEETGDLVNDAVYKRNRTVEEMYNVKFETIVQKADWGSGDTFNKALSNTITAGDDAYDLIAGYAAMILGAVTKGYFINWYDLPTVDISNPWWSAQIADCLTVNGKMYAMTGDIALSIWKEMMCIYFNQKLAASYGVNGLYDTVRSGGWTFDRLNSYSKNVSGDLNGDGKYTSDDLYGYTTVYSTEIDAYQPAFEIRVLSKGKDGKLAYALNTERTVGALQKLAGMFFGGGNYAYLSKTYDDVTVMFPEDKALFFAGYLKFAENFRGMDTDYGIVPYPKYDETQKKYYSTSRDNFSLMLIPSTETDTKMAGTITEALCAASCESVIPVYYDIVLKDKYSRDADSAEMLDIIRDSLIYDIGYLNSYALNGAGHIFVELVRLGSTDLASSYASKETGMTEKLNQMLAAYE